MIRNNNDAPRDSVIFDERDRAEIRDIDAQIKALERQKIRVQARIRQRRWRDRKKGKQ